MVSQAATKGAMIASPGAAAALIGLVVASATGKHLGTKNPKP